MANFRICFRRRSFHVLDANWRNFALSQPAANATKQAELFAIYEYGAQAATSPLDRLIAPRTPSDVCKMAVSWARWWW